jgi:type VI protein secretion system component VasF
MGLRGARIMHQSNVSEQLLRRREENLQAMRSLPSVVLGCAAVVCVLLAFIFYDQAILQNMASLSDIKDAFRAAL